MPTENPTVTITVAVISASGAILVVLIKILYDILKNIQIGKKKGSEDFVGKWDCVWIYNYPTQAKKPFKDKVEITKASGDKLFATGSNNSGTYDLIGSIKNNDIILLSYSGENLRNVVGGVVVLIADKKRKSMQGRWDEYINDGNFRGGTTTWEKDK
jgi:hypothetical protein